MATRRIDIPDELNLDIKKEALELSSEKGSDVHVVETILELTDECLKIRKAARSKKSKIKILGKEYKLVPVE